MLLGAFVPASLPETLMLIGVYLCELLILLEAFCLPAETELLMLL